jgi:hypothetical protein
MGPNESHRSVGRIQKEEQNPGCGLGGPLLLSVNKGREASRYHLVKEEKTVNHQVRVGVLVILKSTLTGAKENDNHMLIT